MTFHRENFCRLMLKRVEAVLIARENWIGATSAAIHIAMENILRAPGFARSRRRCHAPTAPTTIAVVR